MAFDERGLDAVAAPPDRGHRGRMGEVGRVWALTLVITVLALGVYFRTHDEVRPFEAPFHVPWWALAVMFFLTETYVLRIRYRGQAQSFALNELPLVVGLFYSEPPELIIGLLLGSSIAVLRRRRQTPLQLAFNMSHFFLAGVVANLAFSRVVDIDPTGPLAWSAALAATVTVTMIGYSAITWAAFLAGTHLERERLSQVLSLGLVATITTTTVALVGVDLLWQDRRAAVLLAMPAAVGLLLYRGYRAGRAAQDEPDLIYESTRMLHRSPEVGSAILGLLRLARGMMRAERAEITLFARARSNRAVRTSLGPGTSVEPMVPVLLDVEELRWAERLPTGTGILYPEQFGLVGSLRLRGVREAMVVSIGRDDRLVATILIGNRIGEVDHFDLSDVGTFEPFARNLGSVLESGTLEQSLQQLRDLEAQLRLQAYQDPLTALPNRSQFVGQLEMAMDFADDRRALAVLVVNIDDFKGVNDSLGHPVGDQVLVAVAGRLKNAIGAGGTAARMGGDEFGVLLEDAGADEAEKLASAIFEGVRRPLVVDSQQVQLRCSVGIATADSGSTSDEVLRNADVAMNTAKASGKNQFLVYSPDMHVAVIERRELTADLQRAIERDEFVLQYQPVVDLATGRLVAAEALVRWHHPRRGMVPPDDFIPLAEETGLILPVGRLVLQKACEQARRWHEEHPGHHDLRMAVNLSGRQLHVPSFVEETLQVVAEAGVAPETLILEITETVLMDQSEVHIAKLEQVKAAGLRLAMDDFGTGYSSLSLLARLPVDILKVAKPFVESLGRSDKDDAFVRTIVNLARAGDMAVIAEGVERREQLVQLRALGCDMGQGHYFAAALDAAAVGAMLAAGDGFEGAEAGEAGDVIPFPPGTGTEGRRRR